MSLVFVEHDEYWYEHDDGVDISSGMTAGDCVRYEKNMAFDPFSGNPMIERVHVHGNFTEVENLTVKDCWEDVCPKLDLFLSLKPIFQDFIITHFVYENEHRKNLEFESFLTTMEEIINNYKDN